MRAKAEDIKRLNSVELNAATLTVLVIDYLESSCKPLLSVTRENLVLAHAQYAPA